LRRSARREFVRRGFRTGRRIAVQKTAFRAPNTNAYLERYIQTIQQECLDHFVILGQRHCDHLVKEWLEHYHTERPHQAKDNDLISRPTRSRSKGSVVAQNVTTPRILCKQRLGGLLKSYCRKAA
jgi:putative transposase